MPWKFGFPLKKSIQIRSSLTWRHVRKYEICVTMRTYLKSLFKTNISSQLSLRISYSGTFSKSNSPQRQPARCIFQYCSSIIWKIPVMKCNFCKFVCNALLFLTTGTKELYFITSFCWTTTHFFYKNTIILAEPQYTCIRKISY